jgi:hypothetical protein
MSAAAAVDVTVRTMFHATHGVSKSSRARRRSSVARSTAARVSLSGTLAAIVTRNVATLAPRAASSHGRIAPFSVTAAIPVSTGAPNSTDMNAGLTMTSLISFIVSTKVWSDALARPGMTPVAQPK